MPRVNFFEIPFDDVERVTKFYSTVFGWQIEKNTSAGFDYYLINTKNDVDVDGRASSYSGDMIKKREPADHIVIYVDVPSVEEYAKKVNENGGKILVQKTEVKDMGYFIYCEDSEQNRFVLWEGM
ncbi:MAG: VOC family protein [Thermoproteota archaeon]|nr:VOC family protein [Thermoproteota archaeon]